MTFITDKIKANGWREADLDVVARALIEAARREGAGSQKRIYAPMTDAEWTHHRKMQNLQFAFTDARTVLSVLVRDPDKMSGLTTGETFPVAAIVHTSDCAVHNLPADEPGACDCGAGQSLMAVLDLSAAEETTKVSDRVAGDTPILGKRNGRV